MFVVDVLCALLPASDIVTVTEFHMEFHKIWEEQCRATHMIRQHRSTRVRLVTCAKGGRRFEKDLHSAAAFVPNYRIFPPSRAPGC